MKKPNTLSADTLDQISQLKHEMKTGKPIDLHCITAEDWQAAIEQYTKGENKDEPRTNSSALKDMP